MKPLKSFIPLIFLIVSGCGGDCRDCPDAACGHDAVADTAADAFGDIPDDGLPDSERDTTPWDVQLADADTTAADSAADGTADAVETPDESPADVDETDVSDALADTIPDEGPADTYVPADIPEDRDFSATGFFHVQTNGGRWWFVTPDGKPFYSIGVNACGPGGSVDASTGKNRYNDAVKANYADYDAWADATVARLESWGFNTVGAWSDHGRLGTKMPYTVILNISGVDWQVGDIPDYFSEEFAARCESVAASTVAPRRDDPNLIGWFLDNELRWGWDWRSPKTLLADYLAMPETTPGRKVAEAYRGDPEGFLKAVASQYFFVTTTAVRRADPNHLILGIRSISVMTHPQVPQAAGPWVDVYSVNNYEFVPELYESIDAAGQDFLDESNWLAEYYRATGRPILITEFSMRSSEADVPSTWPVFYPTYPTQVERAAAYEAYTRQCFAKPYIIGQHWFQWVDEPAGGRFDGENSNFGLVDGDDVPYQALTETMTRVHADAPDKAMK